MSFDSGTKKKGLVFLFINIFIYCITIALVVIFLRDSVTAVGVNNPYLPHIEQTPYVTESVNYSNVNVNDSQYLNGYTDAEFWKVAEDQNGLTGYKSGSFNLNTTGNINSNNILTKILSLNHTIPTLSPFESDAPLDEKLYKIYTSGGNMRWSTYADDGSSETSFFLVTRTGTNVDSFQMTADEIDFNGNVVSSSDVSAGSFSIGANTLDTTEWSNLDGQDQGVKTTNSPTFTGININGLATINHTSYAGLFIRNNLTTDSLNTVTTVRVVRNGQMADGFGASQAFEVQDSDGVANSAGAFGFSRVGADNNYKYTLTTTENGNGRTILTANTTEVKFGDSTTVNKTLWLSTGTGGTGNASIRLGTNTRDWRIQSDSSPYNFHLDYIGTDTPLSNIITVSKAGNVGIGTTSPGSKLEIAKLNNGYELNVSNLFFINSTNADVFINAGSNTSKLHIGNNPIGYSAYPLTIWDNNGGVILQRTGTTTESFFLLQNDDGASSSGQVRLIDGGGLKITGNASTNVIASFNNNGVVNIGSTSTTGGLGIGISVPTSKLQVLETNTNNIGVPRTIDLNTIVSPSSPPESATSFYNTYITATTGNNNTNSLTNIIGLGMEGQTSATNNGTLNGLYGLYGIASHRGFGKVNNIYGILGQYRTFGLGNATNGYGIYIPSPANYSSGLIENTYGIRILNQGLKGNVFSAGLYLDNQTGSTNSYGVYSLGGNNYFKGNVGIGTSTSLTEALTVTGNVSLTQYYKAQGLTGLNQTIQILKDVDLVGLTKTYCNITYTGGIVTSTTC